MPMPIERQSERFAGSPHMARWPEGHSDEQAAEDRHYFTQEHGLDREPPDDEDPGFRE